MSIEDRSQLPDWEAIYKRKQEAAQKDLATRSPSDWAASMRLRQRFDASRREPFIVPGGSDDSEGQPEEFSGLSSAEMLQLIRDERENGLMNLLDNKDLSPEERSRAYRNSINRVVEISRAHKNTFGIYGLYAIMDEEDGDKRQEQTETKGLLS